MSANWTDRDDLLLREYETILPGEPSMGPPDPAYMPDEDGVISDDEGTEMSEDACRRESICAERDRARKRCAELAGEVKHWKREATRWQWVSVACLFGLAVVWAWR